MRNAISKLRKFPDCAEHIHVLQIFQCFTQKVDAKFQHVTTVCTGLCMGGPEYKEFLCDNSVYPSLSWGPEYKEFPRDNSVYPSLSSEYKEFPRDNSVYLSLSWGPEYKEFPHA